MYMSYVAHVVPLPLQFLSDVLFELVHFLTEVREFLEEGLPMLGVYYYLLINRTRWYLWYW